MSPPAAWVRSHPPCVELNELDILAAAALLQRGSLRSGLLRRPLPSTRRRRPRPAPLPPAYTPAGSPDAAGPTAIVAPAGPGSPGSDGSDDGVGGLFVPDDDIEDDVVPSPSPSPALPLGPPTSPPHAPAASPPALAPPVSDQAGFDAAQRADQARLPWNWATHGKATEAYVPTVTGKWWSRTQEELSAMTADKRRDFGHIGRIMETELGERLEGDERCAACREREEECWVYSKKGAQQVSRPGSTCARCRVAARAGGCSHSKRRHPRPRSPPAPGPRSLAAYRPSGPPPPPPGGSAIAV